MKKIITSTLVFLILIACGEAPKETSQYKEVESSTKKKATGTTLKSADYSSLFNSYECGIKLAEVATVLEVAAADLSIAEGTRTNRCYFQIDGFGKSVFGGGTQLHWGPLPSSKSSNKKEIASYLERKKNKQNFMGMDIQLAETGDCYLAYQPAHGRLIIYNEHYDTAFILNYGQKNANTDRTKEQHDALKIKMTAMANYLLKKHRK